MAGTRSKIASLIAFDFSHADWPDAARGTVVAAAVTAIPVLAGTPKTAIPLSIGATYIAISEAGEAFVRHCRTMLWPG